MSFFTSHRQRLILSGLAVWLLAVGAGLWALTDRSFVPGPSGDPAAGWPAETHLVRAEGRHTLVVMLHPECPCSLATVEELDAIVARAGGRVTVHAICVQYDRGEPGRVEDSRIWRAAQRIAGVNVVADPGGGEARRFAALTSGEVRLYGPAGDLRFRGGITVARGHAGDNPGRAAVLALIQGDRAESTPVNTPVFGCAL